MVVFQKRPTRRAQELRNSATDAERKLWTYLSRRQVAGVKFSRQIPIGPFICDFVSRSARLVVEVDGSQHAENEARDLQRTAYIEGMGFRMLRFWNNEVLENIGGVVSRIEDELLKSPPLSARRTMPHMVLWIRADPPASGRGKE